VNPDTVEKFIELVVASKKIFVFGVGRSGLAGQFLCVRLVQLGLDVHFIGDMTTPVIEKDDLTVLISNTGGTASVVSTANIAGRIGSKVVSVTAHADSNLANASDAVIHLPVPRDKERAANAPLGTLFEESTNLFFDSIVPLIMKRLEMTESDMRKRHAIWV
jgi:6-phospho-3-hexuloisomerase